MAHILWADAGRPSSGDMFQFKKSAKYFNTVRESPKLSPKLSPNKLAIDELLSSYMRKDFGSFWKTWKNKVNKRKPNNLSTVSLVILVLLTLLLLISHSATVLVI